MNSPQWSDHLKGKQCLKCFFPPHEWMRVGSRASSKSREGQREREWERERYRDRWIESAEDHDECLEHQPSAWLSRKHIVIHELESLAPEPEVWKYGMWSLFHSDQKSNWERSWQCGDRIWTSVSSPSQHSGTLVKVSPSTQQWKVLMYAPLSLSLSLPQLIIRKVMHLGQDHFLGTFQETLFFWH